VQNYLRFPLCFTHLCASIFYERSNRTAKTNNGSYTLHRNSHNALHRRPSTNTALPPLFRVMKVIQKTPMITCIEYIGHQLTKTNRWHCLWRFCCIKFCWE